MRKKLSTFGTLLALSLPLVGLFSFTPAFAASTLCPDGSAPVKQSIGVGIQGNKEVCGKTGQDLLKNYLMAIWGWGTALISALAVLVIIFGGYRYMTSGGSPDKIESAKNMIVGALSGLLLIIFSYVILNAINPDIL